jgi:hypothetical protein
MTRSRGPNSPQALFKFLIIDVLHGTKTHAGIQNISKLSQASFPTSFQWESTHSTTTRKNMIFLTCPFCFRNESVVTAVKEHVVFLSIRLEQGPITLNILTPYTRTILCNAQGNSIDQEAIVVQLAHIL